MKSWKTKERINYFFSPSPRLEVGLESFEAFIMDIGDQNGVPLRWDIDFHYHSVLIHFQTFNRAQSLSKLAFKHSTDQILPERVW